MREYCTTKRAIDPVTPTYTWTLTIPAGYPLPLPPLTGSGDTASVAVLVPGAYSCTFTAKANRECAPPDHTIGPRTATVADVVSVEWDEYAPESTPLGNCTNNGGRSIFPGKRYAVDPSADIRNKIALKATISPVVEGCTVYFRAWDIDDPFDQNNSGMPNVSVIDGDTSGPDNRGSDPGVTTGTVTTDANGEARFTVTVSMQPGNNYRAGASVVQSAINATTQTQADANAPPQDVLFTEMLTVWRKLHVEVDSMAAPDYTNTQTGMILQPPTFDPATNHAFIPLQGLEAEFNDTDQQKVGRIDILTFGSFTTVGTDISGSPYKVEIVNAPANIVNAAGVSYTLWDDDAGSEGGFTMVGFDAPPVTLPKVADTALMAQVFQNAYTEPVPPDMQYYDPNTPFAHNIPPDDDEAKLIANRNADLTSTPEYWVVHVTSSFQGWHTKDNDPDTEEAAPEGLQYGLTIETGFFTLRSSGSMIFLETIRDHSRGNAAQMGTLERYTVTHEVGHQFILQHSDGFAAPAGSEGDYIMTNITDQTGMAPNVAFSPTSLNKIRSIDYPPQPN